MIFVEEKARKVSKGNKIFQFFWRVFNVMIYKKLKSLLLVTKCSWIVYYRHSGKWQSKFAYVICYNMIRYSAIIFCDT